MEPRRALLLPLADLLAVTREFICAEATRPGLDRCLRRHGLGKLQALELGYLNMDVKYLPQMADETQRRYLFVATDSATRWVFVAVKKNKTAASAKPTAPAHGTAQV